MQKRIILALGIGLISCLALFLPVHTNAQESVICPGFIELRLIAGGSGRVTPGDSNNVRAEPSRDATLVGEIPGEGSFFVLEGPTCAENTAWWKVDYEGMVGWTAEGMDGEYWLESLGIVCESRFASGDLAEVLHYFGGEIREQPTRESARLGEAIEGTILTALGELQCDYRQSNVWIKVDYEGIQGWVPEQYTFPCDNYCDGTPSILLRPPLKPLIPISPEELATRIQPSSVELAGNAITAENASQIRELQHFGDGPIQEFVWSPNKAQLAIVSAIEVRIYDVQSLNAPSKILDGHPGVIQTALYSPDGQILVTADAQGTAYLWDTQTWEQTATIERADSTHTLDFNVDGTLLAVGTSSDASVWAMDGDTPVLRQSFETFAKHVEFISASNRVLVLGYSSVTILNPDDVTSVIIEESSGNEMEIVSWALSSDGKDLTAFIRRTVGNDFGPLYDYFVSGWDLELGESWYGSQDVTYEVRNSTGGLDVLFSPDETQRLLNLGDQQQLLYRNREQATRLNVPGVTAVAYSPDSSLIAMGTLAGAVQLYAGENYLDVLYGINGRVESISFSADGQYLAAQGEDNSVRVWKVETRQRIGSIQLEKIATPFALSPDGKNFVSALQLWNVASGQRAQIIENPDQRNFSTVFYRPDGRLVGITRDENDNTQFLDLLTGELLLTADSISANRLLPNRDYMRRAYVLAIDNPESPTVYVFDYATGEEIQRFERYFDDPIPLAFSPDSRLLLMSESDRNNTPDSNKLLLWDVITGDLLVNISSGNAYTFNAVYSPSGDSFVWWNTEQDGDKWTSRIGIFDLRSQQTLVIEPLNHYISAITYSTDGSMIAAGDEAGIIHLWNSASGEEIISFSAHPAWVRQLTFSADGSRLFSAGSEGILRVWGIEN